MYYVQHIFTAYKIRQNYIYMEAQLSQMTLVMFW